MKQQSKKSLGDRMKEYERAYDFKLSKRSPVIIRLDGRAFHTLTKNFTRPYDDRFMSLMLETAVYVFKNIQGAKVAYTQSDEISILVKYYDELDSEPWFNNEVQKIVSISAALASSFFSVKLAEWGLGKLAQFDSRVFIIPEHDVNNYFVWRQQDWERNSIQMLGQSMFSQKDLNRKSCSEITI